MNYVAFYNSKDEIIAFIERRKLHIWRKLMDARITVRGHIIGFNTEKTRWLGVYLNMSLQFQAHECLSFDEARKAVDRVRRLCSTNGLEPGRIRIIQVVAEQAVAIYSPEL